MFFLSVFKYWSYYLVRPSASINICIFFCTILHFNNTLSHPSLFLFSITKEYDMPYRMLDKNENSQIISITLPLYKIKIYHISNTHVSPFCVYKLTTPKDRSQSLCKCNLQLYMQYFISRRISSAIYKLTVLLFCFIFYLFSNSDSVL